MDTLLLVVAGLVAGFVNTLAGGGSLLTIPALMLVGLPGDVANATNRVAVIAQSTAGSAEFARAGKFQGTQLPAIAGWSVLGALIGGAVATVIPNDIFEPLILVFMIGIALLIYRQPAFGSDTEASLTLREHPRAIAGLIGAGFYGGFLQAGVGFMLLAVLCGQLRYDLARANALKVAVVVIYTAPVIALFWWAELLDWGYVLPLAIGTVVGAWAGVRFAINVDPARLRRFLLIAVIAMCGAIIYRQYLAG